MLYRVFPFLPGAGPSEPGGPRYVPRDRQGVGRHDAPDRYGALYVSRSATSAIAERIQGFRGQTLVEADLGLRDGTHLALATFDDEAVASVIDLDDPAELVTRDLRPSRVATRHRPATRAIAQSIFDEGHAGFAWWSTLEADWINVTLFAERVAGSLTLDGEPEVLSVRHPLLRSAAESIGVRLQ